MISDVSKIAMDAITKEMKYESFIEKEEIEREQKQKQDARLQLEETKDKMVKYTYILATNIGMFEQTQETVHLVWITTN